MLLPKASVVEFFVFDLLFSFMKYVYFMWTARRRKNEMSLLIPFWSWLLEHCLENLIVPVAMLIVLATHLLDLTNRTTNVSLWDFLALGISMGCFAARQAKDKQAHGAFSWTTKFDIFSQHLIEKILQQWNWIDWNWYLWIVLTQLWSLSWAGEWLGRLLTIQNRAPFVIINHIQCQKYFSKYIFVRFLHLQDFLTKQLQTCFEWLL